MLPMHLNASAGKLCTFYAIYVYYTLIKRATFLLYNDAKRMHERNKYFETDTLKDTWGKTNGTFS